MSVHQTFRTRRRLLAERLPGVPVLLTSGELRLRSYPADPYVFRASSHYLYFGGTPEPGLALLLVEGTATLFRDRQTAEDRLWHGPKADAHELQVQFDYDELLPLSALPDRLASLKAQVVQSLSHADLASHQQLESLLGRSVSSMQAPDLQLAQAVVECRLRHDATAQKRMQEAVEESVSLQQAIWSSVRLGGSEAALKAAHDHYLALHGLAPSFTPILTVRGEVLHNHEYGGTLSEGDLVLIDCGAALPDGWCGDLTRTVPASGRFSPTQAAIYRVVDEARRVTIEATGPGVFFRDLHFLAARTLIEGLKDLGVLKGSVETLLERRAHTLFFPHGLGHLLGLDAHDMEDLGDLAGYEEGFERASEFGTSSLRLARHLEPGMIVTIEPGFYQIPQLLDGEFSVEFADLLDRNVLRHYSDVRGIRIEDNVLVTRDGRVTLSSSLPTEVEEIEARLE